ncbi:unnamed protein product, partial [Phaeothamnion confervicola]
QRVLLVNKLLRVRLLRLRSLHVRQQNARLRAQLLQARQLALELRERNAATNFLEKVLEVSREAQARRQPQDQMATTAPSFQTSRGNNNTPVTTEDLGTHPPSHEGNVASLAVDVAQEEDRSAPSENESDDDGEPAFFNRPSPSVPALSSSDDHYGAGSLAAP